MVRELTAAYFRDSRLVWEPVGDERVAFAAAVASRILGSDGEGPTDALPGADSPPAAGSAACSAEAASVDPDGPLAPRPPLPRETEGSESVFAAVTTLRHDVFRVGDVLCCRRCAGYCCVQSSRTARKLRLPCDGLSKHPATRRNQLTAIDRISRGLAPRQRGTVPEK